MNKEISQYEIKTISQFILNSLKNNVCYSFSELLEKVRAFQPNFTNLGFKLNQSIESLEKNGEIFRLVKDEKVSFLITRNFEEVEGIIEWQNDRHALIHVLNKKGDLSDFSETGVVSFEESENVLNGDVVSAKKIPDEFKTQGYEFIILNRISKSTTHCLAKVVEIEEVKDEKISKCVLLEKNFRFPIILERINKDESFDYEVGDFIEGVLYSDDEFLRGEELNIDIIFKNRIGNINDEKIESLLALKWLNIQGSKENKDIEEEIESTVNKNEIKDEDRKDLRNMNFISIDSAESKDLDDAIFIQKTKKGYKIYVAISDVSYFVKENSLIDEYAKSRNQTFYFPHMVVPMLPKKLSEQVLSLNNDGENKKVIINEIVTDEKCQLISFKFYPALIRNHARLTYNDIDYYASNIMGLKDDIDNHKKENLNEEDYVTTDLIETLINFSIISRKNRVKNEDDNYDEFYPQLNNYSGKVSQLKLKPKQTLSGSVVEELMLLANKSASQFLVENKVENSIFRNQMPPSENYDILTTAKYEAENKGHYSLNFESYTHFTSPVRRYIDLKVHRLIRNLINKENVTKNEEHKKDLFYSNKVSRRFKQAQKKALQWLVIEYLKNLNNRYYKAKIVKNLKKGWIVQLENINLQSYIGKPKDINEIKFIEEKDSFTVEIAELDFCKEKLILKIKTDKIL